MLDALIFEGVVRGTLAGIFKAVPLLGLPVIKQIVEAIVWSIAKQLQDNLIRHFEFRAIERKVDAELATYETAVQDLRKAMDNPKGSNQEVKDAQEEVRRSVANLVRLK